MSKPTERVFWQLSFVLLVVGIGFIVAALVFDSPGAVVLGGGILMLGGFGVPLFISIIEAFTKETRP